MYQVLYRKWRPKTFEDVSGQEHITETLKNEIISGRIAHAYLFTGSRGIGKTTCAKILAKAVNCKKPQNGNPCLECEFCKDIESEKIMDITEIDAASNNGVENIRSMREEAFFSPSVCKYRIYIVDEVHMLSIGAFNAFLKILEEPPEHVIFILATTEIHKLPATIISRCQRFDFYRPSVQQLADRIKFICKKEKIKIEEEAAKIISEVSDGAFRDAISILDRCVNREDNSVKAVNVKEIIGITGQEHIFEFTNSLCEKDISKCLELIDDFHKKSKSMVKFCEELLEHFRNIMIFKTTNLGDETLKINTEKLSLSEIFNILDILKTTHKDMSLGNNKKTEMELATIKICERKNTGEDSSSSNPESKSELTEKLLKIRDKVKEIEQKLREFSSQKATIKNEAIKAEISSPKRPEITLPDQKDAVLMENWNEVLENLKNSAKSKSIYVSLKDSQGYLAGNFVLIDAKTSLAFELLRESANRDALKNAIKEVTGEKYNLGPYKSPKNTKKEAKKLTEEEYKEVTKVPSLKKESEEKIAPQPEIKSDPMDDFLKGLDDDIEIQIN